MKVSKNLQATSNAPFSATQGYYPTFPVDGRSHDAHGRYLPVSVMGRHAMNAEYFSNSNTPYFGFGSLSKSDTGASTTKKKKKSKKPRQKKGKGAPKRPRSAYHFFFQDEYRKIRESGVEEKDKDSNQGFSKPTISVVVQRWKEISPELLEEYKAKSEKDHDRYKQEMEEYRRNTPTAPTVSPKIRALARVPTTDVSFYETTAPYPQTSLFGPESSMVSTMGYGSVSMPSAPYPLQGHPVQNTFSEMGSNPMICSTAGDEANHNTTTTGLHPLQFTALSSSGYFTGAGAPTAETQVPIRGYPADNCVCAHSPVVFNAHPTSSDYSTNVVLPATAPATIPDTVDQDEDQDPDNASVAVDAFI